MMMAYHGIEVHACSTALGWFASWYDGRGRRHATGNVDTPERALEQARDLMDDAEADREPVTPRD